MQEALPTIRQLRYLRAVAEERHFGRAAQRCGVTQPSLTAQIQRLEETLGLRLLERGRALVALTPAGREAVKRAQRVLDEAQGLADFAAEARGGLVGAVRLGVMPTLGPYLLPHVVVRLHQAYPDLKLYVRESLPRLLESELETGVHDLILTQLPASDAFEHRRLFREPLLLALAADHPLAKRETVGAADLAGAPLLSMSPDFHLHGRVEALCAEAGAVLQRDYEGTSLDALRVMVGMGMGATLLPALYIRSEITAAGGVCVRPLAGKPLTRAIGLAWRKSARRIGGYDQIAEAIRDTARQFDELRLE